jgi:hypothetical protein
MEILEYDTSGGHSQHVTTASRPGERDGQLTSEGAHRGGGEPLLFAHCQRASRRRRPTMAPNEDIGHRPAHDVSFTSTPEPHIHRRDHLKPFTFEVTTQAVGRQYLS